MACKVLLRTCPVTHLAAAAAAAAAARPHALAQRKLCKGGLILVNDTPDLKHL
jgi:cytochrome c551/c552